MEKKWFLIFKKNFFVLFLFSFVYIFLATPFSFANTEIIYQGQIDFVQNQFDLVLDIGDKGSVVIKAKEASKNKYHFSLDSKHVKTPFFDISSNIEGSLEYKSQEIYGKVQSQYTLVDYRPIRELTGLFEIKEGRFYLSSFSVGSIDCSGYVDLESPYKLDLIFNLSEMPMDGFLEFWTGGKTIEAEGGVAGTIKVFGSVQQPILRGNLVSFNGRIKALKYDNIYLNAEGLYPYLKISNSILSQTDGLSFTLEGPFNLKDRARYKKQIQALTKAPVVNDSSSGSEWTIKRFKGEEEGFGEIKYFLRKEKEADLSSDEDAGVLGVERTLEF